MATQQPAAGWYTDPGGAGWRYWDGERWTERQAGGWPGVSPDEADRLPRDARRATMALAVAVPLNAVGAGFQTTQVRQSRRALNDVRTQFETLGRQLEQPGTTTEIQPALTPQVHPVGSIAGLPTLVIGIVFLIWFHRAARIAAGLGRPARRSPGWAAGGWLIPIGNLFLPYQSARDFFRPTEPGSITVKRWWTAYLVAAIAIQPFALIAGLHDHNIGAAFAGVCALAFVLWLAAFVAARAFIEEATSSLRHELDGPEGHTRVSASTCQAGCPSKILRASLPALGSVPVPAGEREVGRDLVR